MRALPPRRSRGEPESTLALLDRWFRPLAATVTCLLVLCLGGEAWLTWRHGGPAAAVQRATTTWLLQSQP